MTKPAAYVWVPGQWPAERGLNRMRTHFRRPATPMGEAWFMGERKIREQLMTTPPEAISTDDLHDCLWDIASGTSCFGHLEEWESWFRYLLPTLIARGHERWAFDFLSEHVATAFIQVFWTGIQDEYPGFRDDVLGAMSLHLMRSELWLPNPMAAGEPAMSIPAFLVVDDRGEEVLYGWDLEEAPGIFAAGMCICLKYLPTEAIVPWVNSILAIRHPHWRAALLVWLHGARDLLREEVPRASTMNAAHPRIQWQNSHVLGDEDESDAVTATGFNDPRLFLRRENTTAFFSEIRRHLTPATLERWEERVLAGPSARGRAGPGTAGRWSVPHHGCLN
jgi:hypothetical protein